MTKSVAPSRMTMIMYVILSLQILNLREANLEFVSEGSPCSQSDDLPRGDPSPKSSKVIL